MLSVFLSTVYARRTETAQRTGNRLPPTTARMRTASAAPHDGFCVGCPSWRSQNLLAHRYQQSSAKTGSVRVSASELRAGQGKAARAHRQGGSPLCGALGKPRPSKETAIAIWCSYDYITINTKHFFEFFSSWVENGSFAP